MSDVRYVLERFFPYHCAHVGRMVVLEARGTSAFETAERIDAFPKRARGLLALVLVDAFVVVRVLAVAFGASAPIASQHILRTIFFFF